MKKIAITLMFLSAFLTGLATSVSSPAGEKAGDKEISGRPKIGFPAPSGVADQDMADLKGDPANSRSSQSPFPNSASDFDVEDNKNQDNPSFLSLKSLKKGLKGKMPNRPDSAHAGKGAVFGILALVFGLLGFLVGWIFWPVGLLFAVVAIVFGAIGMTGGRPGKGMAIAGLIFGILTLVLPVLLMALILAILI